MPFRAWAAARTFNLGALKTDATTRAETRQALSALALYGISPGFSDMGMGMTGESVAAFLDALDWTHPWHAGSHFSHAVFFLSRCPNSDAQFLLEGALRWIAALARADGGWYRGEPLLSQRINGAMKIITGLRAAEAAYPGALNVLAATQAQALIDTALLAINDQHACDHFNVAYVLRWASHQAGAEYRRDEISSFMFRRIERYREHYFEDDAAFSFLPGHANRFYYGAPLTLGRAEPDIHGTTLFLWGLSTIEAYFAGGSSRRLREQDA